MSPTLLAFMATWFVVLVVGVLVYLCLRQYGQALLERDALSEKLAHVERAVDELAVQVAALAHAGHSHAAPTPPDGLPIGSQAPEFSLPDLAGRLRTLAEFLSLPRLVVFFSTQCSFCQQMAPRIGQLGGSAARVLLIGSGDAEQYRRLAEEHDWRCDVVLDQTGEVLRAYQATGTPTGYLVDAQGRIASQLASGADALFTLVPGRAAYADSDVLTADTLRSKEESAAQRARAAGLAVRDSGLRRSGLPAGTRAPEFTLPDLVGQSHSLAEFRGKRTLLVFSDPACGPCQAMAPQLRTLYEQHRDNNLNVVLIGRGDVEANRAKAHEHGFEFPVLLQQHWEVSREYAMFATPVGYLLDEQGVILKDVAVGADAIVQLV